MEPKLAVYITERKISVEEYVDQRPITGVWQPLQVQSTSGIMGKRFDLYRNSRTPYVLESGYLIDGFENRPGVHPWQGEHIGKYIHTVVMDYLITKDPKTKKGLDDLVKRLLATQLENGYLGTYPPNLTFMKRPENGVNNKDVADDIEPAKTIGGKKAVGRWAGVGGRDVWTFRYNLHGLLFYAKYFPNEEVVTACEKWATCLTRRSACLPSSSPCGSFANPSPSAP